MGRRRRLDAELVRRGLARSREQAAALVKEGRVRVAGGVAIKPATQIDPAVAIVVATDGDDPGYASRGGFKLAGALAHFAGTSPSLRVEGRRCLDAGASTGGFTDVLLRNGAQSVVAVDVGYGQLAWPLQTDSRVTVLDRTNIRKLNPAQVAPAPSLVVGDLSFISLRLVLPALVTCAQPGADLLLMVKPQFEVGRERLGAGGVVRDPVHRAGAVLSVAHAGADLGLGVHGVVASTLPGPSGNVEYFVWLAAGAPPVREADVLDAVERGPA